MQEILFKKKKKNYFKNASSTPWTISSLVGVPGIPIYGGRETVLCNSSYQQFTNFMNNLSLPFTFDHAVAIME